MYHVEKGQGMGGREGGGADSRSDFRRVLSPLSLSLPFGSFGNAFLCGLPFCPLPPRRDEGKTAPVMSPPPRVRVPMARERFFPLMTAQRREGRGAAPQAALFD